MFIQVSDTLCFCSHLIKKKNTHHRHWSITFKKRKHASRELLELLSLKDFIYKGKRETLTN